VRTLCVVLTLTVLALAGFAVPAAAQGDPDIVIDPESFSFVLPIGGSGTDVLTIANDGQQLLEWVLEVTCQWLTPNPWGGVVDPGGYSDVELIIEPWNLDQGTYECLILIFSNDPDEPMVEVPVTLEIVGVVINEIYPNPPGYYDGAEFIEIYNPHDIDINIGYWSLAGTEYGGVCGGEDFWRFPGGTMIHAGEYVVVAKDGGDGDDGFYEEFGYYPDFEMYDANAQFTDTDNPNVPNMNLQIDDPSYSDEIQLVGGSGYGVYCTSYDQADVVYLYSHSELQFLSDLVEYHDPYECDSDPCPGDDGADDNSYPGIAYLGLTLGRDSESTDTDNSCDDFDTKAATPGGPNMANEPPYIWGVSFEPIPASSAMPTILRAHVSDEGALPDTVQIRYRVDSGPWMVVAATQGAMTDTHRYTAEIPAQGEGAVVDYYVRAVDMYGATTRYPAEGAADPHAFRVDVFYSIYDVQVEMAGRDGRSQYQNEPVNVQGVVTAGEGVFGDERLYIHEGTGAYRGVVVVSSQGFNDLLTEISETDTVTISGTVREIYGETQIRLDFPSALVVRAKGDTSAVHTDVSAWDVSPDNPMAEMYEGQLVRVSDLFVVSEPNEHGEWYAMDLNQGTVQVDDTAYYGYDPTLGDVLTELGGLLAYSYGQYEIEPRGDDDIVGPPRVDRVRYLPIPPEPGEDVTISARIASVSPPTVTLQYRTGGGPPTAVAMTPSGEDTYSASIGPFTDGQRIYYAVMCTAGGMDDIAPDEGYYQLYVGVLPIDDIQYVPEPGVDDASPYAGMAVNTFGVVTAEPGVYEDFDFYIQDGEGPWNGIRVYDRTSSLSLERGDEVIVCGNAQEYYGETEIYLHFPDAVRVIEPSRATVPPAVEISTPELQEAETGEQYEGVLVHAMRAEVFDDDVHVGEWAISNTPFGLPDTCRVGRWGYYAYDPVVGDSVCVMGVVAYLYGNYRIEPRGNPDVAVNPVGVPEGEETPSALALRGNYPNPFNPVTKIAYDLPASAVVTLRVYTAAGRLVRTLLEDAVETPGRHSVAWDGCGEDGTRLASGVYFCRLDVDGETLTGSMVLLK